MSLGMGRVQHAGNLAFNSQEQIECYISFQNQKVLSCQYGVTERTEEYLNTCFSHIPLGIAPPITSYCNTE